MALMAKSAFIVRFICSKLNYCNMTNPFELLESRLSNIESILLDLKHTPTVQPVFQPDPEPLIYGIKGLAEFLKVSIPTAQKIKSSGRVPYSQAERTIIFRKDEVLNALSNKSKKIGGRHA